MVGFCFFLYLEAPKTTTKKTSERWSDSPIFLKMLIKSQRLTLFSPLLSKTRRIPVNSHQTLVAESVITRRTLGAITATPSFHKNPVVIRRRIKLERVTRNCVRIDREIDEEEEEEEKEMNEDNTNSGKSVLCGLVVEKSPWNSRLRFVYGSLPQVVLLVFLYSSLLSLFMSLGSSFFIGLLQFFFYHIKKKVLLWNKLLIKNGIYYWVKKNWNLLLGVDF